MEKKRCQTCEILRLELECARQEKMLIIEKLNPINRVETITESDNEPLKPILPRRKFVPYAVRQQMQTEQDQQTLNLMIEKRKEMMQEIPQEIQAKATELLERDLLGAKA